MRKVILITSMLFFAFLAEGFPQSLNLRFNTYFYTWKRLDSVTTVPGSDATYTTQLRGYQNLSFDYNIGKWTISSNMQVDEDVLNQNKNGNGFSSQNGKGWSYRFYDALVKGSNLFNVLDLKIGRQYLTAGAGRGTIDGASFKFKLGDRKEAHFSFFGGYLTPGAYDFTGYNKKFSENYLAGAQLYFYGVKDLSVGLSYANKRRAMDSYWAIRPDEVFNQKEVLIEPEARSEMLGGMDVRYRFKQKHNFYGRAYWDFLTNKFQKGEINANIAVTDKFRFSAGYYYRQPQLSINTIFWVFNYQKYQEVEGGLDYAFKFYNTDLNVYGRVAGLIYDDDNSIKIQFGVSSPWYGLGYTKYTGYAGGSDGVYGYFNKNVVQDKLVLTSSLSYSSYNIGDYNTEKSDVFSGVLGFTYRPINHISVDAQGQFLTNDIYKFDTRFLVGFNYWFFKNFKK